MQKIKSFVHKYSYNWNLVTFPQNRKKNRLRSYFL
ncbi:hypothetical protein CLOLEP_03643 [[Clostridium] leptum DSM 753]|uniref:Uncharacterized protein n=1 Tax=[Clostridium] leptum DSM 753 TaxID=428125 RepID=A7VYG5_9FIRM|nr:hypothetical protein CLOLEP_03643 [[Clostridium] leptum DSM 753]